MRRLVYLFLCVLLMSSCGKDFLGVRSISGQRIPVNIEDFQALLDNNRSLMNGNQSTTLGMVGTEEFYLRDAVWNGIPPRLIIEKNSYIWADEVYENNQVTDWDRAFERILTANIALEGVEAIEPKLSELEAWKNAKGSALFYRAYNHYQLVHLFCKPFEPLTADHDLGLPLRLESDISIPSSRSSLSDTYRQIISDLETGVDFLPDLGLTKFRPSKFAAYFLLSNVYLHMGDHAKSREFAKKALGINGIILDYNKIGTLGQYSFLGDDGVSNPEISFYVYSTSATSLSTNSINVDTNLLALYDGHDLRGKVYYGQATGGNTYFKGSYVGGILMFTGFTSVEALLVLAECEIKLGNLEAASEILHQLHLHRYDADHVPEAPLFMDQLDALKTVYEERRKELAFRGRRWEDLRRLNKDQRFSQTLYRTINGVEYALEPNSKKYVWQIPRDAIVLGGLVPNER